MGWTNPEAKKAYDREYRKTPQYIAYQKAYRKEYYLKNKEKKLEQNRTPHRKAYMKEYAKKNREKNKEYRKAYYEKHKETKWKDDSGWKRNIEHEKEYNQRPEVIERRSELNKLRWKNRPKEQVEIVQEKRRIERLERLKDPLELQKSRDYHRKYAQRKHIRVQALEYGQAQRDNLTDVYVTKLLKSQNIKSYDETIVEIKRLQLKIEREINNQKDENSSN